MINVRKGIFFLPAGKNKHVCLFVSLVYDTRVMENHSESAVADMFEGQSMSLWRLLCGNTLLQLDLLSNINWSVVFFRK